MLYAHLDELRERTSGRLAQTLRQTGGTPQARTERDVMVGMYTQRLAQLDAAEMGLCFGRIDSDDGDPRYIGRLGIRDDDADYKPLLLDWRAPVARPFYLATPVSPDGVRRRRHITTVGREVTGLDDEVLDLAAAGQTGQTSGLNGEVALLAALNASRTGRMTDIVETIQVEQDRIIRSPNKGVLVVEGGPGTGKTAVALHRAAYLLYTHRELLARRVVLVVGPSPTFLGYVGEVLPSLGETAVLLATDRRTVPRRPRDRDRAAAHRRAEGPRRHGRGDRGRGPGPPDAARPRVIAIEHDGDIAAARRGAPAPGPGPGPPRPAAAQPGPPLAHRLLLDAFTRQAGRASIGTDSCGGGNLLGEERHRRDPPGAAARPRRSGSARGVLARADPAAPGKRSVRVEGAAEAAAPELVPDERDALLREPDGGLDHRPTSPCWTRRPNCSARTTARRASRPDQERRERVAYARGVLDLSYGSRVRFEDLNPEEDAEVLSAHDILDAERLAERYEEDDDRTAAERAAADRTWAFGHIVVDEAQELSPMAWRLLMRRCPTRSMTLVGDPAQTAEAAGSARGRRSLGPLRRRTAGTAGAPDRQLPHPGRDHGRGGRRAQAIDPELHQPRPVRETGISPWQAQAPPGELGVLAR